MGDVLPQQRPEVALVHDDQVVEALAPQRPHDALSDGVRLGCRDRREDGLDTQVPHLLDQRTGHRRDPGRESGSEGQSPRAWRR